MKTYMNLMNRLEAFGTLEISVLDINDFATFCSTYGVRFRTSEILPNGDHRIVRL